MNKLDDLKVVLGQMIRVQNVEKNKEPKKHSGASLNYIAIQIENFDGEGERCLLFTEVEASDMEKVQLPDVFTKGMVFGRLYWVGINRRPTYLLKVKNRDKQVMVLRVSKGQLEKADRRAQKHPMSVTVKSKMTDLFD